MSYQRGSGGCSVIGGLIAGLCLSVYGGLMLVHEMGLKSSGVEAVAHVDSILFGTKGGGWMEYSFSVGGKEYDGKTAAITSSEGSRIPVKYLPSNPNVSVPVGEDHLGEATFYFCMGLVILVGSGAAAWYGLTHGPKYDASEE